MKSRYLNRIKKLSLKMEESEIDLCIILQNVDLYYFTGTLPQGVLTISKDNKYFFGVIKPLERAITESPLKNIFPMKSMRELYKIIEKLELKDVKTIGLETDVVPWIIVERIRTTYPNAKVVNISKQIREIRAVKEEIEINEIKKSGKILSETFKEIKKILKNNFNELHVAAEIESFMRKKEHQGYIRVRKFNFELYYGALGIGTSVCYPSSFDGPVGAKGLYASVPYFSGREKIKKSDTVLVDLMAGVEGYLCDGTRTYLIQGIEKHEEIFEVHQFALELQEEIRKKLKPGVIPENIYLSIMEKVKNSPWSENFMGWQNNKVGFIGHGVGLEIDELPVLAKGFKIPLVEGNVIAVEPKFFFGNQACGIENTFLVTSKGGEKLIPFADDIIVVD
jgi:Xaa-Pro aminopeptidase